MGKQRISVERVRYCNLFPWSKREEKRPNLSGGPVRILVLLPKKMYAPTAGPLLRARSHAWRPAGPVEPDRFLGMAGTRHATTRKLTRAFGARSVECCRKEANKGIFIPFVHDCHNAARKCLKKAGLPRIKPPGGRLGPPCDKGNCPRDRP